MHSARRILELGTLGGYSTIWLARALEEGGRLITLEIKPEHARVASGNIDRAGLSENVEIRTGPALETLRQLEAERCEPFDFFFIDADKKTYPEYLSWSLKLSRNGSVIVVDNVVRGGAVLEQDSSDPSVLGVRRMNEMIAAEPRLTATTIQTVGSRGYDGFALILVDDPA
jgi:predicted O-methyltransferase YrrM